MPEFTIPSMEKVEPDKLRENIPKFKPWISSTAWSHWQKFLETTLAKLATVPTDETSFSWPLLALENASDRRRMQEAARDDNNVEGAQVLEQMLDEERVAVEVQRPYTIFYYTCIYIYSCSV